MRRKKLKPYELQRKQSIDGMSIEDMRDKIKELEIWKKENEAKCQDLENERNAVRTAQILENGDRTKQPITN